MSLIHRLGALLAGTALIVGTGVGVPPAHAETVTVAVPKASVSAALNAALASTHVHIDTYSGKRTGSSWHKDDSHVVLPDSSRRPFHVPEIRHYVLPTRLWALNVHDMNSGPISSHIDGDRINVVVPFESQGPEVVGECLNRNVVAKTWWECVQMNRDLDLDNSRLTISLVPAAHKGSISFADPRVAFVTDIRVRGSWCAGPVCDVVKRQIRRSLVPSVEGSVKQGLLAPLVRDAVAKRLRTELSPYVGKDAQITKVEGSGAFYRITVQRPDRVDATSVQSLTLAAPSPSVSKGCPTTLTYSATLRTRHAVKGTGWLTHEDGTRSATFAWSASKAQDLTSTISRAVTGAPGSVRDTSTRMTVTWKGSDGKAHSTTSNAVPVKVKCSPGTDIVTAS
jgi:hypothetical protein